MTDRKTIQVTLHEASSYGGHHDARLPDAMYLSEFQDWLAGLTKDVPPEFKDEVQIQFEYESDYDSSYATLTVWYLREETDEEVAKREAQQAASETAAHRHNEENERRIYEQLKAKFERDSGRLP